MTTLNSKIKLNKKKIRVGRGINLVRKLAEELKVKNRDLVIIKSFEGGQMPLYRRFKRGFNPILK